MPPTTIINVSPGKWHVAWDGIGYHLMPTIESIQETTDLTLIGSVIVPHSSDEQRSQDWPEPMDALLKDKISGDSALRRQKREEELEHERKLAAISKESTRAAAGIDITSGSPLLIMAAAAACRLQEADEIGERPPLPRIVCDQIDLMLYKVDQEHYRNLSGMQVPHETPAGKPRPPKMPAQLLNQLQWYASVLFTREVQQYGSVRKDARYETWLKRLADRIVARVVNAVYEVDKGSSTESLKYHGLTHDEMVAGLRETLSALVGKYVWEQSPEFLAMQAKMAEVTPAPSVPAPPPAPTESDEDVRASRKAIRQSLRDSYRATFPDVKIADIIWAARQTRREWTRWIGGEAKDGLKADRSFKHVLTSGKTPEDIMGKPRPTKYA
ncbi:MAG: hypothetical protein JSS95_01355 [Acidobacteria bacterium]|nr:hypothetical protein [Acidobacteriota bacterium]